MRNPFEDVFENANPEHIKAIQKEVLRLNGALDDPAWVPFAAAMRVRLETQDLIPKTVAEACAKAASEAQAEVRKRLALTVPNVLQSLALKAAETPLVGRTRAITIAVAALAAIVFFFGGWIVGMTGNQELHDSPFARWIANGNSPDFLQCSNGRPEMQYGRLACRNVFWLAPGSPPRIDGNIPDTIAQVIPLKVQAWLAVLLSVVVFFGAIYAVIQCFSAKSNDETLIAMSWLAAAFFVGWLARYLFFLGWSFI